MNIFSRLSTNTAKLIYCNFFFKILGFVFLPFFLYQMNKSEFSEFNILLQFCVLISVLVSCYKEFFAKSYFISLHNKNLDLNLELNQFVIFTLSLFFLLVFFSFAFQVDSFIFKMFGFSDVNYKIIIYFLIFFLIFDLMLSVFLYNEQIIKNLFFYNLVLFTLINCLSIFFFFLFEDYNKAYLRLFAMLISYATVCIFYFLYIKKKYNFSINFSLNFKSFNFNIFLLIFVNCFFLFFNLFDKFTINKLYGDDILSDYYLALIFIVPAQLIIISINQGTLPQMYDENLVDVNFFLMSKFKKLFFFSFLLYFVIYFSIIICLKFKFLPYYYSNVPNIFLVIYVGSIIINTLPLINNILIKKNYYKNLFLFNFGIAFIQFFIFVYVMQLTNFYYSLILYSILMLLLLLLELFFLKNDKNIR